MADIEEAIDLICAELDSMGTQERIEALNRIRARLHEASPMKHHPVDFVRWVAVEDVRANDYNPNVVAPPEMKLLEHSVRSNGYTMPVVTHEAEDGTVVVDGFHRSRVCSESSAVRDSTHGYLPITRIRAERTDVPSRIASTIEHNRARGEHRVDQMSELVRMLHEAGWRENKIMEELGMTSDEVRRLKQITGLATMFGGREYSEAWEPPT